MSDTFHVTGGARLGWLNSSWPLAKLAVSSEQLTISVLLLGQYNFRPDQVSKIERYVTIPFLGWGIQIHHHVADFPQRIIFWSFGNPDHILQGIREVGFSPTAAEIPRPRGIAMRWSAIIMLLVLWNVPALLIQALCPINHQLPPSFAFFLIVPFLIFSIGTLKSPKLQRIILKPGRNIGEIRPFLRFLIFLLGMMMAIFSMLIACGAFH